MPINDNGSSLQYIGVRYSKQERQAESSIDRLRLRTKDRKIPLNQVARIEAQRGYATIKRVDRHRVITVTSDFDEDVANAQNIVKDLSKNFLPDMIKRFPGVDYDLEGQAKQSAQRAII
jgi:multidrug efflux pump subunit AcrB